MPSMNSGEPYLITAIRQIIDLEAKATLTADETARLSQYRRWLGEHYPDVGASLVREYLAAQDRVTQPPVTWHEVGIPADMRVDGAVVELCQAPDGTLAADLRIPARRSGAIAAETDPDIIRGIERVTGETYHPETGKWEQPTTGP